MLNEQEQRVLWRARRYGAVEVAWFSEAEKACETLVGRGYLRIDKDASNIACLVSDSTIYAITEEGKHG